MPTSANALRAKRTQRAQISWTHATHTLLVLVLCLGLAACGRAAAPNPRDAANAVLTTGAGAVSVSTLLERAPFTLFYFFSATCPVVSAHDGRLRALHEQFAARGVQFVAVDSEAGATAPRAAAEARRRAYGFPILVDDGGGFARALDAEFSTFTLVFGRDGRVLYRGGFDSDRTHLRDDAQNYARDALEDLLAGRSPRAPSQALGCALRLP